ncbi:MAG: SpoIIE family protein phosphatase [Gammaproteobacteria bacterium]
MVVIIITIAVITTNTIAVTRVIKHVDELTDNASIFILNILKKSINVEIAQNIKHPTTTKKHLQKLFAETVTPTGFILLIDKSGTIIIKPHIDFLTKTQLETIEKITLPALITKFNQEKKECSIIEKIIMPNNKPAKWEFRIAKTIAPNHFVVHVSQLSEIEKPERELIVDLLLVNSLILILGLIVSLVLIKKLTNPLNTLTNYLEHFPEKDFILSENAKSEVKGISKGTDDISLMAKAFMHLSSSLQKYITNFKRSTTMKERIISELKAARKIQLDLLPENSIIDNVRDKIDVHALLKPAHQVGGDFYDFGLLNNKYFYFIVGDVSDKSIASAIFMAITKTLIGSKIKTNISPGEILTKVNRDLINRNKLNMFVTVFLGILDINTGKITYSNAGHLPPIILRESQPAEFLTNKAQPVIGVMQEIEYTTNTTKLSVGDLLFVYSDGVTEAKNAHNELFADKQLLDFINNNGTLKPIKSLTNLLLIQLAHFMKYEPQADDITMLAVRYKKRQKNDVYKLTLPAEIDSITKFHDFILDKTKFDTEIQKNIHDIYLAAEEAIINIIKHAYSADENGLITLSLDLTQTGCLIIQIEDQGKPFDPTKTKALQLGNNINNLTVGGIGCHLMRELADEMLYEFIDGKNILTMKFNCKN